MEEFGGVCLGYMVILDVVAVGSGCAVEAEDGRDIALSRDCLGAACGALLVLARRTKCKWNCIKLTRLSIPVRLSEVDCSCRLYCHG